ncbi:MAG TPA: hypothetical protein VLZ28_06985 [Daejeonella sp.]|nr:hypothetical protein [Daejeonella sp.]
MITQEIDHLTEHFYQSVCFSAEHYPNFDQLQELFYGSGKLINNNLEHPLDFTVQTFGHAIMAQIEAGEADYFVQQEISDKTEIFGTMAQRISVFEYSFIKDTPNWKRGVSYIQFICIKGKWLITSIIWSFEKEGVVIPEKYML